MKIHRDAVLHALQDAAPEGLNLTDLERHLSLGRSQRGELKEALSTLNEDGHAHRGKGGRWFAEAAHRAAAGDAHQGEGTLRVFPSGRSDIRPDDGGRPVKVHRLDRGSGVDGDHVRFHAWDDWDGEHGRVETVVDRGRERITGRLIAVGSAFLLEADDPRLPGPIDVTEAADARPGEAVVARIQQWPQHPDDGLQVTVSHRLGDPQDPRTEVRKLLIMEDIAEKHSSELLADVAQLAVDAADPAASGRTDLRGLDFYTIDPGDARDFDDAVCVEPHAEGWRLHVAVADVSHYITAGSVGDQEAQQRALSVYLPDRAIHMLPPTLATDICSLAPGDDRLAMVVSMTVDAEGEVDAEEVCAAVIRSRERLTYEGVARVLAGRSDQEGASNAWRQELGLLTAVAGALRQRRMRRGGLDLDLPEAHVVLDEDDPLAVRDVRPSKPDRFIQEAYRLIEECMVAANEAVGRFCAGRDIPVPWRVHETPSTERLREFVTLARELGIKLRIKGGPTPQTFQKALHAIGDHPAKNPLQIGILRCLSQAAYDATNVGHFALAAPAYLHFTSPIRRYPDLITHRVVKRSLAQSGDFGGDDPAPFPESATIRQIAVRCSEAERRAAVVERSVVDMYRAWVMRERVGDVFDATVTGVMAFGLFVQVGEPFVEGLIKREALGPDHWDLSEGGAYLVGARTGRRYGLGEPLRVRLVDSSVVRRQITFELETPPAKAGRGGRQSKDRSDRSKDRRGRSKGRRGRSKGPSGRSKGPSGRSKGPSGRSKGPSDGDAKRGSGSGGKSSGGESGGNKGRSGRAR